MPLLTDEWKGPWPWDSSRGVGIRLVGRPKDRGKLIDFLQSQSCNPIAARRHADKLELGQEVRSTLQSAFDFERLKQKFDVHGVRMTICPPCPLKKINKQEGDYQEMKRRLASGELKPDEIGPYR
jgi:hypothetical protein